MGDGALKRFEEIGENTAEANYPKSFMSIEAWVEKSSDEELCKVRSCPSLNSFSYRHIYTESSTTPTLSLSPTSSPTHTHTKSLFLLHCLSE